MPKATDKSTGTLEYTVTIGGKSYTATVSNTDKDKEKAITDDNNVLKFTYQYHDGITKAVDIRLDNGNYSRAGLQDMLQRKLNEALEPDTEPARKGEGLTVQVGNQITMTSKMIGRYSVSYLDGGFYKEIMMGTATRRNNQTETYEAGKLVVDDVYIAGRKDVRNHTTKISMKLDAGTYRSDALVKEIQKKLSQQLKDKNLPENMVLVDVGKYNTGVAGADDKNSLFFYLNNEDKSLDLEPGSYGIDGLSGKALFSIFYKTDGDPIPAYITGSKDIDGGVEIVKGENDTFTVDVDGKTYSYEIPEGTYDTARDLADAVDKAIEDAKDDSGLKASLSGNSLKLSYEKLGVLTLLNQ